ncbi:glycosyltransferase [Lacrimispora aerotolerans]|uniref:glycosyltransferase n=1 Tax=Lacrimispora aerotolerans TaxID=36832 RepID=UPI00068920AC|nr:glycosyltransferase [Lacrimispora aerotolerans]
MKKDFKFSVVIVTYNRLELLKECLENVINQNKKFDEIIIINNCSTDGTDKYLSKIKDDCDILNIYTTEKNIGGAGGFSLGVTKVDNNMDYVLLIDDDAMLDPCFLKNIYDEIEESIFAYSGPVLVNGNVDTSHRRNLVNSILMQKKDVKIDEYSSSSFLYDLSTFCGLMVSTEVIHKIGLPLKEYFIWYDDTEYSMRVIKYTKIKNVNSAIIYHKTTIDENKRLNWKSYYGYRNAIDMGKRHSRFALIYTSYRYIYHLYRWIYYKVKSFRKSENQAYFIFCSRLNLDVIKDSKAHRLGINKYYYPGKVVE